MSPPLPPDADPQPPTARPGVASEAAEPGEGPPVAHAGAPPRLPPLPRWRAVAEAVLCSSYPTQILTALVLSRAGVAALRRDGGLDPVFVIGMAVGDAVLVVALVVYLLRRRGESVRAVMLGRASRWREASLGASLVLPVTMGVALVIAGLRVVWPGLHNVETNPMTSAMADPGLVVAFALVVMLAGGLREEMQRAFQLHRLAPGVMPPWPALLLTSVSFGAGHLVQGRDVAIATGLLGALWGALWIRRGSIVAPAVCHALFNLGQLAAAWWVARHGLPA